jgi:lipopolysaccharide export system permease protein
MIPVLISSVILSYLMILFNNDVLPEANHKARILLQDISRTKPTFILEPGKFSNDIGNARILVKKTFENSNKIEDVFIYDYSNTEFRNILTAKRGDISFTSDFKNIVLNLEEGEIHQLNVRDYASKYRKVKFEKHRITLDAAGFGFQQSSDNAFSRGDRELSSFDMNSRIDSLRKSLAVNKNSFIEGITADVRKVMNIQITDTVYVRSGAQSENKTYDSLYMILKNSVLKSDFVKNQIQINTVILKQIDAYDVEIYKKYSIPFACLVFALLGAPLGYKVKRGGFGIAAGFSLLFFLIYWAALIGGEKLADRGFVSPFMGMWIVNIVLGVFGLYLMFKSS